MIDKVYAISLDTENVFNIEAVKGHLFEFEIEYDADLTEFEISGSVRMQAGGVAYMEFDVLVEETVVTLSKSSLDLQTGIYIWELLATNEGTVQRIAKGCINVTN